ncbi:MAG: translation initiation factor IF-2 associated domain-containing protein, partial [Betaproteobacteria bacterium]
MSNTTVAEFASELKKSNETLLEQLKSAGVAKAAATDFVSDADKQKLLNYLQTSHGTASADRKKITLVKRSTSEIKQADSTGRARTIQVEVRKKRTFIRRDEGSEVAAEATPAEALAPASFIDDAELMRREEEARHQAEFIRRQEDELAQKRQQREEQEAQERAAVEQAESEADARAAVYAAEKSSKTAGAKSTKAGATALDSAATEAAALAQAGAKEQALQEQMAAREAAAAASKARADEDVARAADLETLQQWKAVG